MLWILRLTVCLLCLGFFPMAGLNGNEALPFDNPVTFSLVAEEESIQPGRPFWVAIHLDIEDNWHTYWKNPGDAGMPLAVNWTLPEGFEASPLVWPTPKRFDVASAVGFGYEEEVTLLTQITPPSSYSEKMASIAVEARWVVCSDMTCLPGDGQQILIIPVKAEEPAKASAAQTLFEQARLLVPKKHEAVTAKRKNDLIEIAFVDSLQHVRDAEFFPEHKKAMNVTVPSLLQPPAGKSEKYVLVMQELSAQEKLKGVLVLHTEAGDESYEVDVPISPAQGESEVSMVIGAETKFSQSQHVTTPHSSHHSFEFEGGVAMAIVFAFLGGMILNLMPCVLPVVSFKVLGFVKLAGESRKLIFQHGIAFSVGVLLSFWALAALLLILQAYGRSVGWGFQLQEPLFVAVLAAFLFIFGLSLFGVFEFGTSIMSAAGDVQHKTQQRSQLASSFVSGILATAVATPCTGPFLGSAVGFAVTLPAYQAMLIFTALGLGMAFPYLALAAFPALLRFMPKPGPWMATFKELMGFLMMASVVWLVWVFSAQTSSLSVSLLLAGFFLFSCASWVYGRLATPLRKRWVRMIGTTLALVFFGMGGYTLKLSTSPWAESVGSTTSAKQGNTEIADVWEEFSPERVAELREQGIPVFIDFTAKWCLICQTNHLVLSGEDVSDVFVKKGVVRMKADWTKQDEVIAAELRKFGRNSVPLYVLYDSDIESEPQILPQVLTPDAVLESLQQL